MKTYVQLHFQRKNDFTITLKRLYRATTCRRVALYSLISTVMSFLCSKCNRTRYSYEISVLQYTRRMQLKTVTGNQTKNASTAASTCFPVNAAKSGAACRNTSQVI